MERRLTAILAADVVGYSRLMGLDEAGTLAGLKSVRVDPVDRAIAQHQGRTVKLTGDGDPRGVFEPGERGRLRGRDPASHA